MTWEQKSLILIISICMIVISINAVLAGNAFDAQKIVNDSLDSFGLTIFFVGSMRFALSLATLCLSKIPRPPNSIAKNREITRL